MLSGNFIVSSSRNAWNGQRQKRDNGFLMARERDAIVVFNEKTRRSFLMQLSQLPAPSRCGLRATTLQRLSVAKKSQRLDGRSRCRRRDGVRCCKHLRVAGKLSRA